MSVSDEIPEFPETPPERGLRSRGHHEMPLPCPHAVPARPGVVGDERGERRLGAFDEARGTAVVDALAPIGDVLEQAHDRIGQRCPAPRR